EAICADQSDSDVGFGVLGVALQRFLEQGGGVSVVESFVQEAAPANPVKRVLIGSSHRGSEFVARVLVQFEAPVALGAKIRIGGEREGLVARLGFGATTVAPEGG